MQWSRIKHQIESGFADDIKQQIQIYLTTYKNSTGFIGRGWITYKGEEIANFSNSETLFKHGTYSNLLCQQYPKDSSHQPIDNDNRDPTKLVEKGEFSKYDFSGSCWEFLKMNIKDAQSSENPILRLLAVLDKRTGRRSLKELDLVESYPLVKSVISLRAGNDGCSQKRLPPHS